MSQHEIVEVKVRVPRWCLPGVEAFARIVTDGEHEPTHAVLAGSVHRSAGKPATFLLCLHPQPDEGQGPPEVSAIFKGLGSVHRTVELALDAAPVEPEVKVEARRLFRAGRESIDRGQVRRAATVSEIMDPAAVAPSPVLPEAPAGEVVGKEQDPLQNNAVAAMFDAIGGPGLVLAVGSPALADPDAGPLVFGGIRMPNIQESIVGFTILEGAVAAIRGYVRCFLAGSMGLEQMNADPEQLRSLDTSVDSTWYRLLINADAAEHATAAMHGMTGRLPREQEDTDGE